MRATFWGVRGLVPAPGPETVEIGGNTSCVELRSRSGGLFILDAGTGVIPLGRRLMTGDFGRGLGQACVFLTHTHWDHIQGFPFFAPIFVPGNRLVVHGPARSTAMLEGILEGQMNPHFSPLQTMKNLGATIELVATGDGDAEACVADIKVRASTIAHGDGEALLYRFEEAGRALVYAPDVGPAGRGASPAAIELCAGAEVLIHDSTLLAAGQEVALDRVYSCVEDAVELAVRARVSRLVLFHFHPDADDAQVRALAERAEALVRLAGCADRLSVQLAVEGASIEL